MKARTVRLNSLLLGALVLTAGVVWWRIGVTHNTAKNRARDVLEQMNRALVSSDGKGLLKSICVPATIRDRTEMEQKEFVRKALADEVSAVGINVLAREGTFGPLAVVFSNEAVRGWAGRAVCRRANGWRPSTTSATRASSGLRSLLICRRRRR